MSIRNKYARVGRNTRCPCGSGQKFKRCCSPAAPNTAPGTRSVPYIDSGETAIRWVIVDGKGTAFFCDKDDRIIVFTDKAVAFAVAHLDDFADQGPHEINVAGVGEEKFKHLCEALPYTEVDDIETAVSLVRERIALKTAELTTTGGQTDGNQDPNQAQGQSQGQGQHQEASAQSCEDGNAQEEAPDQGPAARP